MSISSPIFKMFAHSPIRPLQEHMNKVHACTETLLPFVRAVLAEDWKKAEEIRSQIAILESEADDLKKDLRLHLPKGLFLPVHRYDLLEILSRQDGIANKAEDISGLMVSRKMHIPKLIAPLYETLLKGGIDASAQACKAINELDELVETGFRGNEVTLVEKMIHTLDEIEKRTDQVQMEIRQKLFCIENEYPPIKMMFLYKLIEWTGDLADRAQNVGNHFQSLLAK